MTTRTHIGEMPGVYEQKAVSTGRKWGVMLPIGLIVALLIALGIVSMLNAGLVGEHASAAAELGAMPYSLY